MNNQCHRVRAVLEQDPNSRWGFVIYRCTYGDDAAWERFIAHLNTRRRLTLEEESKEADLFPRIDWSVQEDLSLDGAGTEEVREKFKQWVTGGVEKDYWLGTPRYQACVMVDKFYLESVLNGPRPEENDVSGIGRVGLVSLNKREGEFKGKQVVGLSYLVPRIYILLNGPGWENFATRTFGEVATP